MISLGNGVYMRPDGTTVGGARLAVGSVVPMVAALADASGGDPDMLNDPAVWQGRSTYSSTCFLAPTMRSW